MSAPTRLGPRFMNAAEEVIQMNTRGLGAIAIQLTGTWAGTVTFEGTIDGVSWVALNLVPTNSATAASTATATGVWMGNIAGLEAVRARVSAYTSGTVEAFMLGTPTSGRY